ncbi:alpha/beta fold hydrolase [Streptomyces sp. NPDC013171]|uniref:alpha/beta fold hydrolase n=1 Tax=Streptomyces sp. NPDC013171 TaxID=3364863 RepID=UPI0036CD0E3D
MNLPAWRMRPFASATAGATAHDGVLVAHVRYRHRDWNGADAHPVTDAGRALDELRALAHPVPVVLVGHSLGGRAVLRAAAGADVVGVVALAPGVRRASPQRICSAVRSSRSTTRPTASPLPRTPGPSSPAPAPQGPTS